MNVDQLEDIIGCEGPFLLRNPGIAVPNLHLYSIGKTIDCEVLSDNSMEEMNDTLTDIGVPCIKAVATSVPRLQCISVIEVVSIYGHPFLGFAFVAIIANKG